MTGFFKRFKADPAGQWLARFCSAAGHSGRSPGADHCARDPTAQNIIMKFQGPSLAHWFEPTSWAGIPSRVSCTAAVSRITVLYIHCHHALHRWWHRVGSGCDRRLFPEGLWTR